MKVLLGRWANEIVELGIDSVNGRVIGDASVFNDQMIPSTWIWKDLGKLLRSWTLWFIYL